MTTFYKSVLAQTSQGRPIELYHFQAKQGSAHQIPVLLIGGVHGDEPEGFSLVERFLSEFLLPPQDREPRGLDGSLQLWVIPRLNPDGCAIHERRNGSGVDLNRNMPTRDWTSVVAKERYHPGPSAGSELETQVLIDSIVKIKPRLIVSAHSWEPMVNYNGPCRRLAEYYGQLTGYRVSDDIGYPTPGSLGTWAGWERHIPTITLEVERDLVPEKVWSLHGEALWKLIHFSVTADSVDVPESGITERPRYER